MVERNGIKVFEGKDCQQIIYKVCQLANGLITWSFELRAENSVPVVLRNS